MRTIRLIAGATIVLLIMAACTDPKESAQKRQDEARQRHPEADAAMMGHAVERWSSLSRDVPTLMDALNSRIELRAGLRATNAERNALDNERAALADLRSGWLQAGSAFASGQAIEAVKAAEDVERRARASLQRLGMESPTPPPPHSLVDPARHEPIRSSPATTLRTDR